MDSFIGAVEKIIRLNNQIIIRTFTSVSMEWHTVYTVNYIEQSVESS